MSMRKILETGVVALAVVIGYNAYQSKKGK